jgi:hypothetical protein
LQSSYFKILLNRLVILTVFFSLLGALKVHPQESPVFRQKIIFAGQSQHLLDTLSIQAASFEIIGQDGRALDSAFYLLDATTASLVLRLPEHLRFDSIEVRYKVFPLSFSTPYFHKNPDWLFDEDIETPSIPIRLGFGGPDEGLLKVSGLHSSGSITRGITIGNKQDLSLQSAMNLQLSGNLSDDIEINAVISDQDMPFQPDGTTRQIQDFDKVYIQLAGLGGKLTAGDFELENPQSHFMHFQRRAQGAMAGFSTRAHDTGLLGGAEVHLTAAGAIAKGKYVRNQIRAIEGNQGPYKLTGANNESFIMILAGTERVFIDGVLMIRGMDQDYVIDYNMAELSFTSRRLITKDSRIVVEFEYAERNYARSVFFTGSSIQTEKASLNINFFSEQDHKNQGLFQELTDDRIAKMASAGDSLHLAFDWNVDSIGFRNDRVMYLMTDSLGYDSVFVFSTDPERAFYRVGFSFVGQGMGNYIQVSSAANGRVFQWVAPVNGQLQGTHEPIIQLVTPKKSQLLSLGADYKINSRTNAGFEFALSNNDVNLFSDFDKDNDLGFGFILKLNNKTPMPGLGNGSWSLLSSGAHEIVSRHFKPIERFRPVEFERDWNLTELKGETVEHNTHFSIQLANEQGNQVRYQFRSFQKGAAYSGYMNMVDARLQFAGYRFFFDGSLLNSAGLQQTDFYRHRAGISRQFNFLVAGLEHQMEENRQRQEAQNDLLPSSAFFDQWLFYITNPVTAINRYRLFHKIRSDRKPSGVGFIGESVAKEYGFSYEFLKNPSQRLLLNFTLRSLTLQGNLPDNTLGGRLDYYSRWLKGAVVSSLFIETASAMERKREYIYLEVPAGQGVYTWADYNGNGIMELDEFELAQFPDQANFIRVFVPTDDFTKVFANRYSHTLNIDPRIIWQDETGFKGFLSRFSNQTNFRFDTRNQAQTLSAALVPFGLDMADTLIVALNSSFRNSLFFNRAGKVFSMEFTLLDNRNKMLLSNGFESRLLQSKSIRARLNVNRNISIELNGSQTKKENAAEFFFNRNYLINAISFDPSISYQFENRWRISLFYGYSEKENALGIANENAVLHKAGLEARYVISGKGNIAARYQLTNIDFPFPVNTPVAFEMLEGLSAGTNSTWNLSWQQNINAWLQLNISYHGRKTLQSGFVNTGTMQIRALF